MTQSYYYGSTVDNKSVLESMDDAAAVALGGEWRMPTDEEWTELRNTDNCSWTWTTIDGVNGYKVQSKKSGYTDNWIFLPAAGSRYYDCSYCVGSLAYYWSSSLDTGFLLYQDTPYNAYNIDFTFGSYVKRGHGRYVGYSVRPVSE